MNSLYKDEYVYLLIFSIFIFVGSYFADNFIALDIDSNAFRVISHVLILMNSFMLLVLASKILQKKTFSFLLAIFYVVSPTHFNVFLFPSQLQFLISETMLLAGCIFLLRNKSLMAQVFLMIAISLNFKLVGVYIFFWLFTKISLFQKIAIIAHSFVIFIFSFPLVQDSKFSFTVLPQTIFYTFETLLLPFQRTIFDMSLLVPNYQNKSLILFIMGFFGIAGIYLLRTSNVINKLLGISILVTFTGTIVPCKLILPSQNYLYNPGLYPMILFILLLIMVKIEIYKEKISYYFMAMFSILWIWSNITFQKDTLNVVEHWNYSMRELPSTFNHEESVKLDYFKILVTNERLFEAEALANEARMKFPNEYWYGVLLNFANSRNDQSAIKKLFLDMEYYQVPYENN